MNLQNGYKTVYEKVEEDKRIFYASKTGLFKDAEEIAKIDLGQYKLVYEANGKICGSISGIPNKDEDIAFDEFEKIFVAAETAEEDEKVENDETVSTEEETDATDTNEETDPEDKTTGEDEVTEEE